MDWVMLFSLILDLWYCDKWAKISAHGKNICKIKVIEKNYEYKYEKLKCNVEYI